jgi:hypothetical protein
MKRIFSLIVIAFIIQAFVYSQSCLPDGIIFDTQEQIDNFQSNFPDCTEIEGFVIINGDVISNLGGLNVLTLIGGDLSIENTSLTSLSGLESLISIGGDLRIGVNFVGWAQPNPNLTDISALENLTSIGQSLRIGANESLVSLSGLENITSIGWWLEIVDNISLTSLTGLENISASSIGILTIYGNELLSTCEVQSICDYLAILGAEIYIENNATGCNSQQEVEDACEAVSIRENNYRTEFSIYPNPATNEIFIESRNGLRIDEVIIYNQLGQTVLHRNEIIENINISSLGQGIYIIELTSNELKIRHKLIIEK